MCWFIQPGQQVEAKAATELSGGEGGEAINNGTILRVAILKEGAPWRPIVEAGGENEGLASQSNRSQI